MALWPVHVDKKLCQIMAEYPIFYDHKSKDFKNERMKMSTLKMVADQLNEYRAASLALMEPDISSFEPYSDLIVKTRFKQVRDRFSKERGKLSKIPSGSSLADAFSKWYLYKELQYLQKFIPKRSSGGNKNASIIDSQNEDIANLALAADIETEMMLDEVTGERICVSDVVTMPIIPSTSAATKIPKDDNGEKMSNAMCILANVISEAVKKKKEDNPQLTNYINVIRDNLAAIPTTSQCDCFVEILQVIRKYKN